jgi:glutamine synthetase
MPKPFSHLTGNGCHFHMSLWRDGENVFLDEADPRGLGLSETAYHFIGGLKRHARAYSAITAPTVNSYKRLKVGTTASGATWSPVWISYGYNNRTQMLRIPGPGRVEDRTIDGSCNPYLAAAAVLAAGLDGIANRTEAGEPNSENLYAIPYDELRRRGLETLPANLLEATQELERCDVLREALGRGRDEDYVDYFIRVKRDEWARYHEQVTPWEIKEYLTRF